MLLTMSCVTIVRPVYLFGLVSHSQLLNWMFLKLSLFQTNYSFVVVQLLSRVQISVTPWTAAHQASLSFTIPWSLLKLISINLWCHPTILSSVTPFSSCPQSFPASGSFPMSQLFTSGGQSIGASASASVLPMNIQDWFPLELTGLILLVSELLQSS